MMSCAVMLSNAKHLLVDYTLSSRVVAGRLYVILSETKDLLAGYTLSTVIARLGTSRGNLSLATHYQRGLSLVGFEEILHSVQNDRVCTQNDSV